MRTGLVRASQRAEEEQKAQGQDADSSSTAEGGASGSGGSSLGGGAGWRARLQAARREAAASMREQIKAAAVGGVRGAAAVAEWRASMEGVEPASDGQARGVARALLNANFGGLGSSWYSVFKAMDRDDSGRVTWQEFLALCREAAPPPAALRLPRIGSREDGGEGAEAERRSHGGSHGGSRHGYARASPADGPLSEANLRRVWKRLE